MSSLVPVVFSLLVSVFALSVASQSPRNGLSTVTPPPRQPSMPPPPLSPPQTPPGSPPPLSPFSPPPSPAPSSEKQRNPKNDSSRNRSAPPPRRQTKFGGHRRPPPPPPLQRESKINVGKKIGLLFSGIAAILQIGVISFLVFKRRQLLKVTNRYETCS